MESVLATSCACTQDPGGCRLVVLTGGPGAGKTATIEFARQSLCDHIALLPSAAGILFRGGFLRRNSVAGCKAAQRAIFHIQREQERLVLEEQPHSFALCDRGSLDGLAYWPDDEASFWRELGTDRESELARYHAVIHLRSTEDKRYSGQQDPWRTEDAALARTIDERILRAWEGHPNRHIIDPSPDFVLTLNSAIEALRRFIPTRCEKCQVMA